MMSEQQIPSSSAALSKALDLVLGDWLSGTSLVVPKKAVVESCSLALLCPNELHFFFRVEAFGSGTVIVPSFRVDVTTTVGDLCACLRQRLALGEGGDEVAGFQLLQDNRQLRMLDPRKLLLVPTDTRFSRGSTYILHCVIITKAVVDQKSQFMLFSCPSEDELHPTLVIAPHSRHCTDTSLASHPYCMFLFSDNMDKGPFLLDSTRGFRSQ